MGEASFNGVEGNGFFLNLYDDLGECSSGRESVRWSLDFGGFSIKDLLLGNRFF